MLLSAFVFSSEGQTIELYLTGFSEAVDSFIHSTASHDAWYLRLMTLESCCVNGTCQIMVKKLVDNIKLSYENAKVMNACE